MKQKTPQLEDLLSMLGQTQDMMEELRQQNSSEQTTGAITTANDTKLDYIGTPGDTYKRLEDYMVSITELVEQAKLYVTNNPDLEMFPVPPEKNLLYIIKTSKSSKLQQIWK